jgi:hypothetical protein
MHERRIGDTKAGTHRVALLGSTLHIGNLEVPLDAAAEYMRGIPEEKWEAAFVHAVQVGMSEIVARRRRFQAGAHTIAGPAIVTRPQTTAPRVEVIAAQPAVIAPQPEPIAPRIEVVATQAAVIAPPEPIAARVEVVVPQAEVVTSRIEAVSLPTEVVKHVEEKEAVQPRVTLPPEPRMEAVEPPSSAACSNAAKPTPEPEGWLRSLDDELETLDSVHTLDASRSGQ